MKKELYTSGEFAKMAHISVRTVRFYDQKGILKPSFVNEAGARFYSESDVVKLQQILLLKYLGFSLDDIKMMIVGDQDYKMLRNSLDLQLKLVKDRMEQMQLVAKAIEDTTRAIDTEQNIDWSQMLNLIHLTSMESSLKSQYQNTTNISARIKLHEKYSSNKQGWFSWIHDNCKLTENLNVLELGCGDGSLWKENYYRLPYNINIVLSDISDGMIRDTKREIESLHDNNSKDIRFTYNSFDCHEIPYKNNMFDLVIANHVLFYCEDINKVLSEVYRVLKPGGTFICSSYGPSHMMEITELVQGFNSSISLSADKLYEKFGLENGESILKNYFSCIEQIMYEDSLFVTDAEPLVEYILSCHGNQNQYILNKYKEFYGFVKKRTEKGFEITKSAGIFVCKKDKNNKKN